MEKETGEIRWFSGTRDLPYDTTYSAPSLVTIDGQRQLVMGAGDGAIWGFQPEQANRCGTMIFHYVESSLRPSWLGTASMRVTAKRM